jgi:hypothetical protein
VSWQATTWALETELDPTSKILLIAYADFAGENGTGAWMFRKTLLKRVAKVSESTINRRLTLLLEEGYMCEGDQNTVRHKDWARGKPPESLPIVYDLAMSEDTRLAWKEGYKPGPRRSAAAAAGAQGGRKSAAAKRASLAAGRESNLGVSVEPPRIAAPDMLAAGGANMAPPQSQGVGVTPPGLQHGATPGGVTVVTPITNKEQPMNVPSRCATPSEPHNGGSAAQPAGPERMLPRGALSLPVHPGLGPSGSAQPDLVRNPGEGAGEATTQATCASPRVGSSRSRTQRTPEQQVLWDQADEIARWWWDGWRRQNVTIVGDKFPGFRNSIVLAALKRGATGQDVRQALRNCGDIFPALVTFQRALAAIQTGRDRPGHRQVHRPGADQVHRDPNMPEAERARRAALFEQGGAGGKVSSHD